jgi:hypothetical protein
MFEAGFEPSPSLPQLTFTIQPTPHMVPNYKRRYTKVQECIHHNAKVHIMKLQRNDCKLYTQCQRGWDSHTSKVPSSLSLHTISGHKLCNKLEGGMGPLLEFLKLETQALGFCNTQGSNDSKVQGNISSDIHSN